MADSQKYAETINVMPSAPAETKTQSNCTVVCDGQGRYTVTGTNSTSSPIVFVFELNEPFTIPKSVGNGGQGTMSLFNDAATNVNCSFFNGNSYIDGWMLSPVNRTHNSYTAQSDKVCDRLQIRIQENSSANVTFSPMFTNDGQYPSEFVPHQAWQHSLRKLTTATEAVENPLYSDGTAITAYTLKGNEEHTGTPSPQNPVMPDGVGERTENLWNETYTGISSSSITYFPIYVGSGDFTLSTTARKTESPNPSQNGNANIFFLTGNVSSGASTSGNGVWNGQNRTVTATDGYVTIAYRYLVDDSGSDPRDNDTILNSGSTAKPYEPYGYKIPILNAQGSAVNYLGSVQSYREISKRVYDGTENWNLHGSIANLFYLDDYQDGYANNTESGFAISNAFVQKSYTVVAGLSNGQFVYGTPAGTTTKRILMKNTACATETDWKTWLADQYAAGTPVTVWYVLQTATTGIVNEPLMKIGTYADSISNAVSIPTTEGANSITVDTTVQPSEFSATWSGWHNAYVKEKSENLFDGTVRNAIISDSTGEETSNNNWRCSDFIKVADTKVTLSWVSDNQYYQAKLGYYEAADTETFLSTEVIQGNRYSGTFTIPENCNYIKISYSVVVSGNPVTREDIMLNEGTTAKTYAPYWE